VEVNENKFGKCKHNCGKHIEGTWVIGDIKRTTKGKFFAEVVDRQDSETIVDVLSWHVLPGTILHSDCWKGYAGIDSKLDILHKTVNHSIAFVELESSIHTNKIEGKWAALKRHITLCGQVKDRLDNYLLTDIWRTKNKCALWVAFIDALRDVHYE
jgi:transposase-like protein